MRSVNRWVRAYVVAVAVCVTAGAAEAAWRTVEADLDGDRDVDGFDFLTFSNCYNGSNRAPLAACENLNADLEHDDDVDGFDFLTFTNCYNGSIRVPLCAPEAPTVESIMHAANRTAGGYEVVVRFTGEVDDATSQVAANYRIHGSGQSATSATLAGDSLSVSLIFDTAMAIADTLDVSVGGGVLDAYGRAIAEEQAVTVGANPADTTGPTASAEITAARQVTVAFNESMDRTTAQTLANYRNTTDGANATAAVLAADGRTVTLTFAAATDGDTVRVSVGNSILDINGNAKSEEDFAIEALQAGVSAKLITPVTPSGTPLYNASRTVNHTHPVYMAGFGNNRTATAVHDDLWARCLAVRFGGTTVAIVSLDVVGYGPPELEEIRSLIDPAAEVDYVVVTSTHTHQGPDTLGIWGPNSLTSGVDPNYLDFINVTAAEAVEEAVSGMVPARVKMTTANSAGLSMELDARDDGYGVADGKVLTGDTSVPGNISGRIVDPNIGIMQFVRIAGGTTIATLMNFGSHPESLGSDNRSISCDFVHYARQQLEAVLGGTAVYVSGDLGVLQGPLWIDVLDPNTGSAATRRTFRFAEVHGVSLADRAISGIGAVSSFSEYPKIDYRTTAPLYIPLANPYFRFAVGAGILPARGLYTDGVLDTTTGPICGGAMQTPLGEDFRTEVGAVRLAEAGLVVVPSELDPQIGFQYRALLSNASHTLIVGLGNDELGYQLPAAKWDNSCHVCLSYYLCGQACPNPSPDCNTVFENNVGQQMDPQISGALTTILTDLNSSGW